MKTQSRDSSARLRPSRHSIAFSGARARPSYLCFTRSGAAVSLVGAPRSSHVSLLYPVQPKDIDEEDDYVNQSKPSEMFIGQGGGIRLSSKAVVFVRNTVKPVDTQQESDNTLLFSEVAGSALQTIETYLSSAYTPMFDASAEWGRADAEQRTDFKDNLNVFVSNVQEVGVSVAPSLQGYRGSPLDLLFLWLTGAQLDGWGPRAHAAIWRHLGGSLEQQ